MVHELLRHGAENAVNAKGLAFRLQVDKRRLCEIVRQERLEGHLILANENGLYLPCDTNIEREVKELRQWLNSLEHRITALSKLCRNVRTRLYELGADKKRPYSTGKQRGKRSK